jgi:hypothetical protein
MEKTKSGFGTTSLVLGIIGICTSFIPIVNNLSFLLGLIGGIFAIVSLLKKASKGQAIAGIILCVLAIIITVNSQKALADGLNEVSSNLNKATGASTEEVLKNDVNVELGNFEVTKGSYGITNTKLTVKVTNKTSEKKSFSLHIEAVDSTGTRIDDGYVYANDLGAGQSQNFDIFTLVTSDKVDAMEKATFKIVEASMY